MATYRNIMEDLIEREYKEIEDCLDCCHCERCHADIIAFALNHVPSKYVVTQEGELFSRINRLEEQHKFDILSTLAQAACAVRQKPKH